MLTSRITVILKQTPITIMATSIYVFLDVAVSFTHFKWLNFKEFQF